MVAAADALSWVVALSLSLTAATLVAAGRRRLEDLLLAGFLLLVGVNFAGLALHAELPARVAFMALALDPLVLLLFVTRYPFRRRDRLSRALLAQAAVVAVVSEVVLVVAPELIIWTMGKQPFAPPRVLLLASLAVSYAGALALAVRSAIGAPSEALARRAAWLVAAVGVVVVPRMALLPADFGLADGHVGGPWLVLALELGLAGGVYALATAPAWRGPSTPDLRRALLVVAGAFAVLYAVRFVLEMTAFGARPAWGFPGSFGLRWIAFSAILAHGILLHEVVELRRATDRILPLLVGAIVGVAACFLALALLTPVVAESPLAVAGAVAVGLGATAPAALLARWLAASAGGSPSGDARRLELYRAALESAWGGGEPDAAARRSLERDRRAFGVSPDEARALEHIVRGRLAREQPGAQGPGTEPVPGLVLGALIAEGAHGRVFDARRFPEDEAVVVKALRVEGGAEEARARLFAESRALLRVRHPSVVRLLDVHATPTQHLLVLARAEGQPLDARLRAGPLEEARARRLAQTLLDGLAAAHAEGVVHRDLKPANVLVAADGSACIADFGVATLTGGRVGATALGFAHAGVPTGTLAYMAPEQARGARVGPPADLFAAALVLAEALTGRPARRLQGATWDEALARVAAGEVDLDDVPPRWRAWLERALAPDPAARWPDARAMQAAMP